MGTSLLPALLGMLIQQGTSPRPDLPDRAIPASLGFNIHIMGPERDLDAIRDTGVKFVRKDLFWNHVERSRGTYDFSGYDRLLRSLEERGIRALFILCYGNELYPKAEETDEGRQAYARFAAEAVRHFKGRRVLWEIWNEPNVKHFWKGSGDHNSEAFADQYVALVRAAVPAMRAADPDGTILGGAVSCLWTHSFRWLDRCFQQGLLKSGIDALSVHPYGFSRPELCLKEGYGHLRDMMTAAGAPKDFPLLNSEVGYDAQARYLGPPDLRLRHQAWHFVRQHLTDLLADVRLTLWYNWNDDPGFRIANPDLSDLPVTTACKTLVAQLAGYRFSRRIPTGSDLDFVLLFEKDGGDRKLVAWTTPPGRDDTPEKAAPHDVRIPLAASPSDSFPWCDVLGNAARVKRTGDALVLNLTGAPQYVHLSGPRAVSSPVARPEKHPVSVPPDTLAAWDARLRGRIHEELAAGRRPRFRWTALGDWADVVEAGSNGALRLQGQNGGALLEWASLSLADRRNLAEALVRPGKPSDHALAAFYLMALGERERARPHLDRAGGASEEILAAFR